MSLCALAHADVQPSGMPGLSSHTLMTAPVVPDKSIAGVDVKEIELAPWRKGAPHLHPVPVFNVVEAGEVAFEVEGQPVQHLKAGDVFYEPRNARIARLDNDSGTPTKLVAFYLRAPDDHELIRLLEAAPASAPAPARTDLAAVTVSPPKRVATVKVNAVTLEPMRKGPLHSHPVPVLTPVEDGRIAFQVEGQPLQHLRAGDIFFEPADARIAHVDNEQATQARLVLFYLLGDGDRELVRRLAR